MQVWNLLHAARWKYRTQKLAKIRHLGTIAQLCRAISSQLWHVLTIGKKLLSSNISSTRFHNMMNFGPLAKIDPVVWGTPANFNGFRVLAVLMHGTAVLGASHVFAALNRGRHLYSAGRTSRWVSAHILVNVALVWWLHLLIINCTFICDVCTLCLKATISLSFSYLSVCSQQATHQWWNQDFSGHPVVWKSHIKPTVRMFMDSQPDAIV